jgi:hypothetical protein
MTVFEGDQLRAGYPAIHTVGRAASPDRPPCLIELTWQPSSSSDAELPLVALVGKGVCFDSGGGCCSWAVRYVRCAPCRAVLRRAALGRCAGCVAGQASLTSLQLVPAVTLLLHLLLQRNNPIHRPGHQDSGWHAPDEKGYGRSCTRPSSGPRGDGSPAAREAARARACSRERHQRQRLQV